MRTVSFVVAGALAMPVAAQAPAFRLGIACDGAMPVAVQITASGPGSTLLHLEELFTFCALHDKPAEPRAVPQRLRST
jgi:hypothetical protein